MKRSCRARILVVSQDEMLRRSRELILGSFFDVRAAGRVSEARDLINNYRFDLLVLCHSIRDDDCEKLAMIGHTKLPRAMVLALGAGRTRQDWADQALGVDANLYDLVKKCASMLGYQIKSKARPAHAQAV